MPSTGTIVFIVVLLVMIAAIVALYFAGKKAQARKDEQDAQMAAVAQTVSMLIIDKKRLRMKDSGLPQMVVKAKVGPKVMTLIADEAIFADIPVKKEVKATVSGIYITGVKGLRGPLEKTEEKKGFRAKIRAKYDSLNAELKKEQAKDTKKKK